MCVIRVSSKRKTLYRPHSDGVQLSSFGFQRRHCFNFTVCFGPDVLDRSKTERWSLTVNDCTWCKELIRKSNVLPCLSSLYFFIKQAQFYENIILSSLFSQNISEGTVYSKRDFWFFDNFGRLAPPLDDAPPRPFEPAIAARFRSALVDPFTNWPPIFGLVPSGAFPLSASCSFENFPFAFASRRACAAFSSRFFFWKMF